MSQNRERKHTSSHLLIWMTSNDLNDKSDVENVESLIYSWKEKGNNIFFLSCRTRGARVWGDHWSAVQTKITVTKTCIPHCHRSNLPVSLSIRSHHSTASFPAHEKHEKDFWRGHLFSSWQVTVTVIKTGPRNCDWWCYSAQGLGDRGIMTLSES